MDHALELIKKFYVVDEIFTRTEGPFIREEPADEKGRYRCSANVNLIPDNFTLLNIAEIDVPIYPDFHILIKYVSPGTVCVTITLFKLISHVTASFTIQGKRIDIRENMSCMKESFLKDLYISYPLYQKDDLMLIVCEKFSEHHRMLCTVTGNLFHLPLKIFSPGEIQQFLKPVEALRTRTPTEILFGWIYVYIYGGLFIDGVLSDTLVNLLFREEGCAVGEGGDVCAIMVRSPKKDEILDVLIDIKNGHPMRKVLPDIIVKCRATNNLINFPKHIPQINIHLPILWINLDRSTYRRERMEKSIISDNIRISGLDGRTLRQRPRGMTPAQTGCVLSHIKAIKFGYDRGYKEFLILEDDATFENVDFFNLREIISNAGEFDVLSLKSISEKPRVEMYTPWDPHFACTAGYVIRRSGCEKLLKITDLSPADIFVYKNCKTLVYKFNYIETEEATSEINKSHIPLHIRSRRRDDRELMKELVRRCGNNEI